MAGSRWQSTAKALCWSTIAGLLIWTVVRAHASGQMAAWFYYRAAYDGYAIDADAVMRATPEHPAVLALSTSHRIEAATAVRVRKGDRLPAGATGVVGDDEIRKGKRARLAGSALEVTVPWLATQQAGFRFRDTFRHKGVEPNPWVGVWNLAMTLGIGLSLGLAAQGLTDLFGLRLAPIRHAAGS